MAVINLDVVMLKILTVTADKAVVLDRVASGNTTGWVPPSATTSYPRHQLRHMHSPSEPSLESRPFGSLEQRCQLTRSQLSKRSTIITSAKV